MLFIKRVSRLIAGPLNSRFNASTFLLLGVAVSAVAQSAKSLGEVPESPDSYRDPGTLGAASPATGRSLANDPSILQFKGNRSPGLPDTGALADEKSFPNFRFENSGRVILYGTDRNGKQFEREVSRAEFESLKESFEKSARHSD